MVATGGGTFVDPQNRAVINGDGVSVWLDVPIDRLIARVPADGRRPLAADRAEFERLYRRAARRVRAGALPRRRRARRAIPGHRRTSSAGLAEPADIDRAPLRCAISILTDIHANLEALETCLADAARAATTRRSCSATSSATAPTRTRSSIASASLNPSPSSAAITTRWRSGMNQAEGFNAAAGPPRTGCSNR